MSYETQSPTVIGLLSHPFPVSRPRPWTSDFRKWRREWGAEKIVPPLKRQLTFIRSANWYKANGSAQVQKGRLMFYYEHGGPTERSDVVVCKIGTVSARLWYGKRPLANSLNGRNNLCETGEYIVPPRSTDSIKFIFLFADRQEYQSNLELSLLNIACN